MADLVTTLAAGFRTKGAVTPTSFGGPLTELSGVGFVREPFSGAWQRNVTIEGVGSLAGYAPVYACATRIASDIAKLVPELLVDDGTGIMEKASPLSPFWPVLKRPNHFQNRIQFLRHWMLCKLIFGNAYALKQRDARGIVTALYLLDPRGCLPLVAPNGDVYYSISGNELARIPSGLAGAPAREIIHDRGPTLWHPLIGVPPLFACALSGSLGLAIQRNSNAFFGNMSRPSGLITGPKTIDPITAKRLKDEWEQNYSKGNLGRTAVMGDNLEYKAMSVAAEQSQLAEQLGISAVDVATAFGMPAYKINQGPMPTNNNVGALQQQYYNDALQVPIEDLELCLSEGLAVPDGYSVECNLDGLLRMDSAALMEFMARGVEKAIIKPNEARKAFNRKPAGGGDELYLQEQNHSLPALKKRDEGPDPFKAGTAAPPAATPEPPPPAAPKEFDLEGRLRQIADDLEAERLKAADAKEGAIAALFLQTVAALAEAEPACG